VVDALKQRLGAEGDVTRLVIDAGRVGRLDPAGAIRLWKALSDFSRDRGATVELLHLKPSLALRLRRHPLLAFIGTDDSLFADPLDSPRDSER
jgi:hypothetical protein